MGKLVVSAAAILLCLAPASLVFSEESVPADDAVEREFTLKVWPLLKDKCFGCHGGDAEDIKGDFDISAREGFLRGGESEEPCVVPGDSDQGTLIEAISWAGLEMPPKENDRLTDEQVEMVRRWIDGGAPWPDERTQQRYRDEERLAEVTDEGILIQTSGGLGDEWTFRRYEQQDVWAFLPVTKPMMPTATSEQHSVSPIDAFIRENLTAKGVDLAPQADPASLIRRATFDLLGLPPSPKEIREFVKAWQADSESAWSDLIDRLLASPHYGERWAQHWLDVARYADTGGYSNDYERSNMWRYRDYVIRAFNEDKPYNEFVVEQLAGDEIHDAQDDDTRDPELLVASSFLRIGHWDPAMVKAPEARQLYLDDVVNAVGQTFLATTMRCCKCHDHKFDPLPTRDYYRMYATFAGTQLAEREADFLPDENLHGFKESKAIVERLLRFASTKKQELHDKRESAAKKWYKENDREYVPHDERKDMPDEVKPPRHVGLDYVEQGRLKVREQDDWIWKRRLERYEPMVQSVYNGPTPKSLNARKLRMPKSVDRSTKLVNYIYTGGALEAPGEEVGPGVLSALKLPVDGDAEDPYVIDDSLQGRRLAFAQWVADENNPLTTRAIVNRIWQYHFGKPLAGNPNNFGAKGGKPTHPKLLDWLAADFVEGGWTIKRMHKQIMMSDAYRQGTSHPAMDSLTNDDPNNELLAYFPTRRLTAEEMRDAMLKITGELNPMLGGLPVMPEINMEVALQPRMIQFSLAPAYQPSRTPWQRNRRSIYAYRVRGQADPFLEVFNQPNPNESCEDRDAAAVSPQAFTLMNSEVMNDRSIALAVRLQKDASGTDAQIKRAFQLVFGRQPTAVELSRTADFVDRMRDHHRSHQPEPVVYPTEITRSLVEEFSGQPFEYQEILPVFENYKSDKKASDVDAETRALADLCLMLFNSNEFIYVY